VLATNDDQSGSDPSSLISWTAPASGTYYIRSTHSADLGMYGSYDLVLEGPQCGMTPCAFQFCVTIGDSDICHQGGGTCSGNTDSGWNTCSSQGVMYSCPAGQHVRLTTCPCTCLGNSCGSRIAFLGCQ